MSSAQLPVTAPQTPTDAQMPVHQPECDAPPFTSPPTNSFLELLLCLLEHHPSVQLCCEAKRGFYIKDTPELRDMLSDDHDLIFFHLAQTKSIREMRMPRSVTSVTTNDDNQGSDGSFANSEHTSATRSSLSEHGSEYTAYSHSTIHNHDLFDLFVSLCDRYFTRMSYCDHGELREVSAALHIHYQKVTFIYQLPDCLAFGDWHSFTLLKPKAKLYRVGGSVHVEFNYRCQARAGQKYYPSPIMDDHNKHRLWTLAGKVVDATQARFLYAPHFQQLQLPNSETSGVKLPTTYRLVYYNPAAQNQSEGSQTLLFDGTNTVLSLAKKILREVEIIVAIKRLLRKSLQSAQDDEKEGDRETHIGTSTRSRQDAKNLLCILDQRMKDKMKCRTRGDVYSVFSLNVLTFLYNTVSDITRKRLIVDRLGLSYRTVDVTIEGHQLLYLHLDVMIGGSIVKHKTEIARQKLLDVPTDHPCITLTPSDVKEVIEVLDLASQSPYERVRVGDVLDILKTTVQLLSTSPDIRWGNSCYEVYNTLLMVYTHLRTIDVDANVDPQQPPKEFHDVSYDSLDKWCTEQQQLVQDNAFDTVNDRFQELVVDEWISLAVPESSSASTDSTSVHFSVPDSVESVQDVDHDLLYSDDAQDENIPDADEYSQDEDSQDATQDINTHQRIPLTDLTTAALNAHNLFRE